MTSLATLVASSPGKIAGCCIAKHLYISRWSPRVLCRLFRVTKFRPSWKKIKKKITSHYVFPYSIQTYHNLEKCSRNLRNKTWQSKKCHMFKCIHVCSSIKGDGVLKDQITNCLNNNVKNNPYQHWPTAFEHIQQGGLYAPAFPRTAGPSAVVSVHRTTWWPSNCWGTPWTYQTFLYPFFPLGVALSAFSEIGLAVMDFLKEMQLRNWLIIVSNT